MKKFPFQTLCFANERIEKMTDIDKLTSFNYNVGK